MKRIRFNENETLTWIDINQEGVITNASCWKEEILGGKLFWHANLSPGDIVYFQDHNGRSKELPGRVVSIERIKQEEQYA